ncbi:hypothetical protein ANOM_006483 [Aspergillus nomiae NRRL 13137]|uniref:BZIP domain-containing protein n=1 Tax=Aspergillus nomiae NRRL (strain ATCC 15546 / NRRL 13137 / CBS 260.88 / M93) TaxID=1509407 RepID=A0A0L1J4L5_ASPN3|nr:uncharacterized protein ANOM_006483 [Aspergillus nomiae NRRL 13137]KNG86615.1 hypothetical protein ANOM_006483 [Aspergillus nomiae NRRL 13137]
MDNTNQKKIDKLARVRENQRKSRARKQEHIRGLEQKLVALQEQVHKKDVEHRLAVQKLEAENRGLKRLCSRLGFPTEIIAEYAQALADPNTAQKVAIPALRQSPATQNQRNTCGSSPSLPRCQEGAEVPHIVELGSSLKTDVLQGAARPAKKPSLRRFQINKYPTNVCPYVVVFLVKQWDHDPLVMMFSIRPSARLRKS